MRRLHQTEIDDLFAMAERGGMAQATAITDCVAQGPDHLMYMEGDTLLLLRDAGNQLLAYCEGEVGWVKRSNIVVDGDFASASSLPLKSHPESSSGASHILPPVDTRSENSTPSRYSGASGASGASGHSPYTPCSINSPYSTFSSQSTARSVSSPFTPHDVSSSFVGISDAHEPTLSNSSPTSLPDSLSSSLGCSRPVQVVELPHKPPPGDEPSRHEIHSHSPLPPQRMDPVYSSAATTRSHPFGPKTALGVTEAAAPLPPAGPAVSRYNQSAIAPVRTRSMRSGRSASISSAHSAQSEYSDAMEGDESDLTYARVNSETRDLTSPTPSLPATISLSALGVYSRANLSTIPLRTVQPSIPEDSPAPPSDNVRHVQHGARQLAVLTEPIYRQSYAAETARISMAPSEISLVEDEPESVGPIPTFDGNLSVPSSSLRRSPALTRLDLTIDSGLASKGGVLPPVDDVEYPLTPGTFGLGFSPSEVGSPERLPTVLHPPLQSMKEEPIQVVETPKASSATTIKRVEMVENPRPRTKSPHQSPRNSHDSSREFDDVSQAHTASEETVINTPQTVPVGSFTDSPLTDDPSTLDAGNGSVEIVAPDLSMTDPLPPHKHPIPSRSTSSHSSLSVMPDKHARISPARSTTPDSPTSVDSRWSVESRAAAKSAMRNGFYALGHAPQLTESQQQTWRNWSANVSEKAEKVPRKESSSSLNDSKSRNMPPPDSTIASTAGPAPPKSSRNEASELAASDTSHSSRTAPLGSSPITVAATPNTPLSEGHSGFPRIDRGVTIIQRNHSVDRVEPLNMADRRPVLNVVPGQLMPSDWPRTLSPESSSPPKFQRQTRPPPLTGLGRPQGTTPRLSPFVGVPNGRPLVRRATSPTVPSFSAATQRDGPPNTVQPQPHRLQRRQTDDSHPVTAHSQVNRTLPTRNASSGSAEQYNPRVVPLPSEIFANQRNPPGRSQIGASQTTHTSSGSMSGIAAITPKVLKGKGSFSSLSSSIIAPPSLSSTPPPRKESLGEQEVITPTSSTTPTLSRSRSRSFSAAIAKSLGKGSRRNGPKLSLDGAPPLPTSKNGTKEELIGGPKSSYERYPKPGFLRSHSSASSISDFGSYSIRPQVSNDSTASRPWLSHSRSVSSPRSPFHAPVSHRDYRDPTINADGMEFEIIRPRKVHADTPTVAVSVDSSDLGLLSDAEPNDMEPSLDSGSESPPELDEWGFIKIMSPTPEIFKSRQLPGDIRAAEQKWLNIIQQPLGYRQQAHKKVRRMVIEQGVPPSLRGRVWAWFMSNGMSGRVDGLFGRLLSNEPGPFDEQIELDVQAVYSDHSAFHRKDSTGQADLRTLLRAYIHFAPSGYRTDIARLAGALLIHAVLEDAFWLLAGLFNGVLKSYYVLDTKAFIIDLNVFGGILEGSEPVIGKLFRSLGVLPEHYLVKWWSGMFIRSLPWPTVLRVLDAVISEGPRYLMIASLAVLTLSSERLLALPRTQAAVVEYLHHLPQDSLLLPETFMRACDQVKLRDEDLKKLRLSVKAQMARK